MKIQASLTEKLKAHFQPTHLEVENESANHHRDPTGETHFRIVIVSQAFIDKSLLERQRMLMSLLQAEREAGLHALTLKTWTPAEWEVEKNKIQVSSPSCRGGGLLG